MAEQTPVSRLSEASIRVRMYPGLLLRPGIEELIGAVLEAESHNADYNAYEGLTYDHPALALADALLPAAPVAGADPGATT